jgi:hypothetical protein
MSTAGQFIVELQGNDEWEMSLRRPSSTSSMNSRRFGRDASDAALAAAVGSEIDRLLREAETLRKLRAMLFGVA